MTSTLYAVIWLILALISWVLLLFYWKYYYKKEHPYADDADLVRIGFCICIIGMALWPVTLLIEVLVGLGYLLYHWILG